MRRAAAAIIAAAGLLTTSSALAQTGANVAVVINENSPASIQIGEYYARRRAVPAENVVRIRTAVDERITRIGYAREIESPIAAALSRHGLQDRVLYIVLTKGVPLRIPGTAGPDGTAASVDSELTLLYRKMTGRSVPPGGTIDNPYYLGDRALIDAKPFNHRTQDIVLVTRLDGFSVEDVIALVDRGVTRSPQGAIVLDQRAEPAASIADRWMSDAAAAIRAQDPGWPVMLDRSREAAAADEPVLGYYSWGSTDRALRRRSTGLRFAPGAIAAMLTSTDARTFSAPPDTWVPAEDTFERRNLFAGSAQSLVGDLIRDGATGVAGNISEPLLGSVVRPQILFPAYLAGFSLAESFYLAMPHLSWQGVVVGDPLCRPRERASLTDTQIQDPVDKATGLPPHFMARRLGVLLSESRTLNREAAIQVLAAEARRARNDRSGATQALTEAARLAPRAAGVHLQLASLHEEDGETERALALYRHVVDLEPRNAVALNNLAYALATRKQALEEAAAVAQKAYTLAPTDPAVLDTLGWIEHLRGNAAEAAKLLRQAVQGAPEDAEIRLHAAFALAAAGAATEALPHLDAAIRIDPELKRREDVGGLLRQLTDK